MWSAPRLAWLLLALGILSTIAALLGPREPWNSIDVGAVGAAVFSLTSAAAIWLFAARGEGVFGEHLSVTERRAWVGLVFISIVLAAYVLEMRTLASLEIAPERFSDVFAHRFMERLFGLVLVWSLLSHLIGRRMGGVEADERDLRLQHHAHRIADWALTLIVIAAIIVLASVPAPLLAWWLAPVMLANLLIGLLIVKSLVEHVVLAFSYRSSRA
jgi:hypothetical protein